jgi:hypothetical protein
VVFVFCFNCGGNLENYNYMQCPYCGFVLAQQQINQSLCHESLQDNFQYNQLNNTSSLDSGKNIATASLVLGILPFVGIGGLICSIPAWILGNKYKKVGNGTNASTARAGKICGIINTVLHSILVLYIGLMALVFLPTFMIGPSDAPAEYEENIIVDDANYFVLDDFNVT